MAPFINNIISGLLLQLLRRKETFQQELQAITSNGVRFHPKSKYLASSLPKRPNAKRTSDTQ
ncbi:condensin subunit Cut3 [Corchorus olitorius]|uniref:Condensin subunit Cut3 n=1 Tax=Corchorus olitorius TaxID=93759 RepID=A0A1R3I9V4_9ROSI|nr:condensin subunit Cut3 [Corchorus olitorius]